MSQLSTALHTVTLFNRPLYNLIDVSKQLGHASVKMTLDVYAHWIPGGKKSEVDGLDSRTAPAGNGPPSAEVTNG